MKLCFIYRWTRLFVEPLYLFFQKDFYQIIWNQINFTELAIDSMNRILKKKLKNKNIY